MSDRVAPRGDEPRGSSDNEPRGSSPRLFAHLLVFLVLLSLWTWKLLQPYPVPEEIRAGLDAAGLSFAAAKSLHAGGYALLTVLAGTLPVPRRWRVFLVVLLAVHGAATEIGQLYVPNRHGRWQDVLIDWAGITAGATVARWWNGPPRRPN